MKYDGYHVRQARPDDLPVLLQFEQEIITTERPYDPTIKPDPVSYYDIGAYITDDNVAVYVIEYEGNIVSSGYAQIRSARHYLDHTDYAHLGFMYTLPEQRGKGLNQLLIKALKSWAIERGISEIRLTVYSDNLPAIRAYQKADFAEHIITMRMAIE